ncbi:MAG: DNA translocase FtsK [Candidatus Sumerlaeaceae bacterium]|nr:DNA translocase FtsK [Candidatus Sumerlaeaceae bacterium]
MATSEMRRQSNWLGVGQEVINDVLALTIILLGIFLLLSLATHGQGGNLMGVVGANAYSLLTFIFGKYVAYIPVLVILLWGISFWRGRRWRHVPARVAGGFFAIVCLCAILAIPYANADFSKDDGFRVGGALGNFLVHKDCLDLRNLLGLGGCYLVFTTLLLVSLIVAGNIHLRQAVRDFVGWCRQWSSRALEAFPWAAGSTRDELDEREQQTDTLEVRPTQRGSRYLETEDEQEPLDRVELTEAEEDTSRSFLARLGRVWAPRKTAAGSTDVIGETSEPQGRLDRSSVETKAGETIKQPPAIGAENGDRGTSSPEAVSPSLENDLLSSITRPPAETGDLPLFERKYQPPDIEILEGSVLARDEGTVREHRELAETLLQALNHFDIGGEVDRIECGPTIVRIEITPPPGVKLSKITCLEADLARALQVETLRIVAPVPGRKTVGFEIPNKHRRTVRLREVIESPQFLNHESPLAVALGVTITGEPYIGDLTAMPHLLIAGATGSGKSVCLNSIICSILFRQSPDDVKFIMIDPKRVELNMYHDIPHLLAPVVTDVKSAIGALKWAVYEMEARYEKLSSLRVRNIAAYNSIVRSEANSHRGTASHEPMPYIVIVIDELADLIITGRNNIEDPIVLLAQKSRAVGMHLIVATQRPSVNIITGIIKANFPCRIAFKVAQKVDSRTILDSNGAENLLGRGDMLFAAGGGQKPIRLQGCYASDREVEKLTEYLREQQPPQYWKRTFVEEDDASDQDELSEESISSVDASREEHLPPPSHGDEVSADSSSDSELAHILEAIYDELFRKAVHTILTHRSASVSLLQRKLSIGFVRAGRFMDAMHFVDIVGPPDGSKTRTITVDPDQYLLLMENGECPWLKVLEEKIKRRPPN